MSTNPPTPPTPETKSSVDPCPLVELPAGTSFPVRVDVPITGLLLRDAEDLKDLNRYLDDIRRIPRRDKTKPQRDPDEEAVMATYFWLDEQRQAGAFEAYRGQYIVAADKKILGIGPDTEEIVRKAMETDPALRRERIIAIDLPTLDQLILR
jgi:hypothetical protein